MKRGPGENRGFIPYPAASYPASTHERASQLYLTTKRSSSYYSSARVLVAEVQIDSYSARVGKFIELAPSLEQDRGKGGGDQIESKRNLVESVSIPAFDGVG